MFYSRFPQNRRPWIYLSIGLGIPLAALVILLARPVSMANAAPNINVCGSLNSNTTWTVAGGPYIITCTVQVVNGVTLTVQSGTMIKFNLGTSLQVDGTLIAQGATFTTNDPTPAAGDWGHIFFTASSVDAVFDVNGNYVSGSLIQDSLIEWGGGGAGVNGAVETASASPFIYRNTIRNNGDSGIRAAGRSANQPVVIRSNSVSDNSSASNGGGIYASAGYIISNTVENNSALNNSGGGVYASASALIGNVINANYASFYGGGIYTSGSALTGNTVSGNSTGSSIGQGGGIYASGGTLINNIVSGNTTSRSGGGIYASGGSLTDNTVSGNAATGASGYIDVQGGGIYASLSMVSNNFIVNNSAWDGDDDNVYGGGIYATGGTIISNTVTNNTAVAQGIGRIGLGGGVYDNGGMVSNNIINNNTASGTEDGLGGGVYGNIATLQQNTLTGNSANKGGAIYSYQGAATANIVLTNTTALSGTIFIQQGTATQNTLKGNTATYGGGVYGQQANLFGNIIQNNTANLSGGGIYAVLTTTVNGNTVMSNTAFSEGGGIYANGGTVSGNTVSFNTVPSFGQGSGLYLANNPTVNYNYVLSNTAPGGSVGGVAINGLPQLQYNNLYGNLPYDSEVITSTVVTGTLNYWGPSPCNAIATQIYDGNDLPGRGLLLYAPSLYSPLPLAQLDSPTNLTIVTGTTTITLTWSAILALPDVGCTGAGSTGPDASYRIYYDADGCPPYAGQGLPQGNSPIDVSQATTLVVNGLGAGDYYFVIAAYDYLGRESAYSNEVIRPSTQLKIYLPLIQRI